jgi:6-phosphofructokinase 1
MTETKKLALMTSGGDVPGLNAAIRAVVRTAIYYGFEVLGIQRGYEGMIDGDFIPMHSGSVSHIISRGGTILQSSRSERFRTQEGRAEAYRQMKAAGVEALILIGGDGSMRGAQLIADESDIPVVGIPKTIDNDLTGTDFAIGFDTAVNAAMEAIDRIKDTARSHNRLFFVEVMGRNAGYIAMQAGIATGAEAILIPETDRDIQILYDNIERKKCRADSSYIVVVAEGDEAGGAYQLAEQVKQKWPELHSGVTVLGHIQRGGSPTCFDRTLATRLGVAAVKAAVAGERNIMVGEQKGSLTYTPLSEVLNRPLEVTPEMLEMLEILSQ